MNTLLKRFMNKVEKTDSCWIWKAARVMGQGYGMIKVGTKTYRAHRLSYELFKGEIPSGMYICHTCDNPPCVNPDHLFLGTASDNNRDKMEKGRFCNGHVDPELHSEVMKGVWASYTPEQREDRINHVQAALEGKPFTEEHLTNLRIAHAARRKPKVPKPKAVRTVGYGTGIPDPVKPHGNRGKQYSAEHRARLSAAKRALWEAGAYSNRKPKHMENLCA